MPISDSPLIAADEAQTLATKVQAYIAAARIRVSDGVTVAELCELILSAMRVAITAVDTLQMAGTEKKKIVVDLAAMLFDEFADLCIPLAAKPFWFFLRPAARSLCLTLAGGAVESLLPIVRGNA